MFFSTHRGFYIEFGFAFVGVTRLCDIKHCTEFHPGLQVRINTLIQQNMGYLFIHIGVSSFALGWTQAKILSENH